MEIPFHVVFGIATTLLGVVVALFTTYIFFRELPRWGGLKPAISCFAMSAVFFAFMGLDFAVIYGLSMSNNIMTAMSIIFYGSGLLFFLLGAMQIAKYSSLFRYDGAELATAKKTTRKARRKPRRK